MSVKYIQNGKEKGPAADATLMQLSLMSDNIALRKRARQAARNMLPTITQEPFSYASHATWIKSYQPDEG